MVASHLISNETALPSHVPSSLTNNRKDANS